MKNIDFTIKFDMHDNAWKDDLLGNSDSIKVAQHGCYITATAMAIENLNKVFFQHHDYNYLGDNLAVKHLNSHKELFYSGTDTYKNHDNNSFYNRLFINFDYWTKNVQGDLTTKITEYAEQDREYALIAKIAWDPKEPDNYSHWVGISGAPEKHDDWGEGYYVKIAGTSEYDKPGNRPSYWKTDNAGNYYIPTDKIGEIDVFSNQTPEEIKENYNNK